MDKERGRGREGGREGAVVRYRESEQTLTQSLQQQSSGCLQRGKPSEGERRDRASATGGCVSLSPGCAGSLLALV